MNTTQLFHQENQRVWFIFDREALVDITDKNVNFLSRQVKQLLDNVTVYKVLCFQSASMAFEASPSNQTSKLRMLKGEK
jgi:hypothetical protein